MTGHVRNRGVPNLCMGGATIISPRSSDLAKLNLICHMNYLLVIFTEISFYPETSILS